MSRANDQARMDVRLPKDQKIFFEHAASLGGFRSLTDLVISSVHEKASKIVEERDRILASERDRQIFFEALMNPSEPNEYLKQAAANYRKAKENGTIKS